MSSSLQTEPPRVQTAGIKLYDNRALTSKRNSAIAFALLDIFTTYGAPAILQSDNGREFQSIAHKNKSKTLEITDKDLDEIISEIKNIWPQCTMVRGRPRHSQSQGGIERLNRTCQTKLGSWMHDNNSKNWSIGRLFVRWQINGVASVCKLCVRVGSVCKLDTYCQVSL